MTGHKYIGFEYDLLIHICLEEYHNCAFKSFILRRIRYSKLSSPPVNLEESWSLKFRLIKILCKKLCLRTCCELDLLIIYYFLI